MCDIEQSSSMLSECVILHTVEMCDIEQSSSILSKMCDTEWENTLATAVPLAMRQMGEYGWQQPYTKQCVRWGNTAGNSSTISDSLIEKILLATVVQ